MKTIDYIIIKMVFLGGFSDDIFGEVATGREVQHDNVNEFLRTKYLKEYLVHAWKHGRLHPDY
jgi:hypothetical protein